MSLTKTSRSTTYQRLGTKLKVREYANGCGCTWRSPPRAPSSAKTWGRQHAKSAEARETNWSPRRTESTKRNAPTDREGTKRGCQTTPLHTLDSHCAPFFPFRGYGHGANRGSRHLCVSFQPHAHAHWEQRRVVQRGEPHKLAENRGIFTN